jgi:hypothetical protein
MRNLILAAVLSTALAACKQRRRRVGRARGRRDHRSAPEASATSSAGTYEVTHKDGTKFTSVLNADGTYQDTAADGSVAEKGTWEDKGGQTCFDTEGGDDKILCFTVGEAAADGSMVPRPTTALTR